MGFTQLFSILPFGKTLPPSRYDDELIVASIDKNRKILSTSSNFFPENRKIVDRTSVAVNTTVNTELLSETNNSSNVIAKNFSGCSIASFKFRIIAAINSCFA